MQHHPGSWYLPWGVPIQKMMAVPLQHPGITGASAMLPYAPPVTSNGGASAATCQMIPNQHSPNSVAAMQGQTAPHNYQHTALHSAAATHVPIGAYNCPTTGAALQHASAAIQHSSVLNGHAHGHHSHIQNSQLQNAHGQSLHPLAAAAAAAMFTPLSLRAFLTSGTNSLAGLTTQQPLTTCGPSAHQQNLSTASASTQRQQLPTAMNVGVVSVPHHTTPNNFNSSNILQMPIKKLSLISSNDKLRSPNPEKRKAEDCEQFKDLKKAKLETKALKAKRPGFTDERYYETSYYIENGLRKVYPYYFTFTTFTKGRWVGEKILSVFAREFRAHPAEEYERCITAGTLTVNYERVPIDYKLKHNDLLANIVHRHEVPVTSQPITIVHMDDDIVVVNKPASIPVHPCGRYRHNTVVFILAKEYNLKNLRTIHRLDRLTSGLLLFGRSPKKARQMEHQIRNRQVQKEYICRVEGDFPEGIIECKEPIEVVSYKIGVCKVSSKGKDCTTTFQKIVNNGKTSVVLCKPLTGRMHQIRVHLQYLGFPVVNDPLYNHDVFGPLKGRGGDVGGKTDDELVRDLINIHNAENWLGIDGDSDISLFKTIKGDCDADSLNLICCPKGNISDDDSETASREASPYSESPQPAQTSMTVLDGNESACENTNTSLPTESMALSETTHNGNCEVVESNNPNAIPHDKVTVATQTGDECPDMAYSAEKMTSDKHCYECKVRYRDPKPKDLVMYLHAWKYKGPGWEFETEIPNWASADWTEPNFD